MPDIKDMGPDELREYFTGQKQVRARKDSEITWRASGDPEQKDIRILTGYPAVFDTPTTLYEDDNTIITETIAQGFFDSVLQDDCHLNYVHESGSAMCRNDPHMPAGKQGGPGSMELSVDPHGLRLFAKVPMNDIDAQRMAPKMDNGVVDQMSFAFTVGREDCLSTQDEQGRQVYAYTLRECGQLFDVTVCPLGAYSQTEAQLRNIAPRLAGRSNEGREIPCRSNEGKEGEVSAEGTDYQRFVADAKARTAKYNYKQLEVQDA
jgi:HK97 family phage prohead protease